MVALKVVQAEAPNRVALAKHPLEMGHVDLGGIERIRLPCTVRQVIQVLLKQLAEGEGRCQLGFAVQLAIGQQERRNVGSVRDDEPASRDESQVFVQPDAGRISHIRLGGLEGLFELSSAESKNEVKLSRATLF
jgi:hypothetical protein